MRPRVKSSGLWAVIAALVYLVGYQAYLLAGGTGVNAFAVIVVALVVAVVAYASTYALSGFLANRDGQS